MAWPSNPYPLPTQADVGSGGGEPDPPPTTGQLWPR